MKPWQGIVLAILIASISVLSACSVLGGGKSKQESDYNRQLKAYQDFINANNKAQEDYNKAVQEGLQKWADEYQKWSQQQQELQLQAQGIQYAENQTQP